MRRQLFCAALLVLALCLVTGMQSLSAPSARPIQIVYAQGENQTDINQTATVPEHEFTFDRQAYKPTKVSLNYPYTNEHDIRNVSTIGMSQYKYDVTPVGVNFIAEQVDVYSFTLELRYENASRRSILIAIWEGDRPMEGYVWTEVGTEFVLHVRLSTTNQPSYPTGDEIADLTFLKFEQLYVQQLEENRKILSELMQSQYINTILMLVAAFVSIVALLLAGFRYKAKKMKGETE